MRRALIFACAIVGACGGAPPGTPSTPVSPEERPKTASPSVDALGREVVEQLSRGEHSLVVARFDPTMQGAMSAEQLAELWSSLEGQIGAFESIDAVSSETADGHHIVTVTTSFAQATMAIVVVYDAEQRVAGLRVRPAPSNKPHPPPPYAELDAIRESEVVVGEGKYALPATLTVPRNAAGCPGLVLVHGSGPSDRDESVGANKPFMDLALGLATRGVCVLRYEKRTRAHGKALLEELGDALTLKEETIDDAVLAVKLLQRTPQIDPRRVFVLGHSLGGTAVPRIAGADASIAGFVVMAGSTLPLEDIIVRQIAYISSLDGTISKQEQDVIARLEAQAAKVKQLTAQSEVAANDLPLGIAPPYWLDLRAHPPAAALATEQRPILVLQGDRDYQVTLEDFEGWRRALDGKPNAILKRYPSLNHLFIPGEGKSAPPEYLQPGHVAPEVIQDIATWLNSR